MLDEQKIEEGVRLLLEGIGEDVNREGLKETPGRVARMCREIYGGMWQDAGEILGNRFKRITMNWCWRRTSHFTPCVSTICFLFMEKPTLLTYPMEKWRD